MQVPQQNLLFAASEPVQGEHPAPVPDRVRSQLFDRAPLRSQRQAAGEIHGDVVRLGGGQGALRRASSVSPDYISQKYLQLPSTLPQRVRDLAHKVAGEQYDPYDKAEIIEAFLRTTYRYAPTVRAPPPGRDPVDFFLFDLKEDFCEYFASAMVVMLRELGVPARVVEGYTTGTLDPTPASSW